MDHTVITALAQSFQAHGYTFYLVGGSVRDEILGRASHDIDCATDALPDVIKAIAAQTSPSSIVPIGEKFGTIQIHYTDGAEPVIVEITAYRSECYHPGSRHPEVRFGTSIHEDLRRRDFTINAIAKNPLTGHYVDPWYGRKDLNFGIIRAVDDPAQRFEDDPLRLLRAVRFAAQFEFTIAVSTDMAITQHAQRIHSISHERIRDELGKILLANGVYHGFDLLEEHGLLEVILPEVRALIGVAQPPHHSLDVFDHTMTVVGLVPARISVRLAALLHDIGKPATKTMDGEVAHFYGHEDVGAEMARAILRRLRFSNGIVEHVANVVKLHMRVNAYTEKWGNGAVRRLYMDAGEAREDLLDLAIADGCSDRSEPADVVTKRIAHLRERLGEVSTDAAAQPLTSPLNGNELMALFGRSPGAWLKPLKQHLHDLVIDGALRGDNKHGAREAAKRFMEQ